MIEHLRDHIHSYPPLTLLGEYDSESHQIPDGNDSSDEDLERWKRILSKMAEDLRNADGSTTAMENPYADEFDKAFEECYAKYGAFEDDKPTEFNGIKSRKSCIPWNYPEWSDICRKYSEEEEKIERFRDKSMKSGLASFTKWFWNLWD